MIETLLSRRSTRDYLNCFPETQWKSVIINTMEIGIESLKQQTSLMNLTLDDIKQILKDYKQPNQETFKSNERPYNIKSKASSEWRTGNSKIKQDPIFMNDDIIDKENYSTYTEQYSQQPIKNKSYIEPKNFQVNPNQYDSINNYPVNEEFTNEVINKNNYPSDNQYYNKNQQVNRYENFHVQDKKIQTAEKLNNYYNYSNEKSQTNLNISRGRNQTADVRVNPRLTKSIGMQNAIYPDWWGCNDYDQIENCDDEDESYNKKMTKLKNSHYSRKLSLREKRAIIEKSRRDGPSSSSFGGGFSRGRSQGVNAKDRIYDRVVPVDVKFFILG